MTFQYKMSLPFYHTINGRVLMFVAVLAVYVSSIFVYSFNQKDLLSTKLDEVKKLQQAETVLLEADLAVFDAITQLLIIVEPANRQEILQGTHRHFANLTEHYAKLSNLFPERAPSFYSLIGSLAKVVMQPTREELLTVKSNLETHKQQLSSLIRENQRERQLKYAEYQEISDKAVSNLIFFTLSGLVVLTIISSLYFNKMGIDIRRILRQIEVIVARKRSQPLPVGRLDEIGMLITGVNDMSEALDVRDRQLYVERMDKSYFESVGAIENLTAGLVHEIGNPVAAISGIINEIEYEKDQLPEHIQQYVQSIQDYNNKLQLINGDLAKIAAPTSKEFQLLDFNQIVSQTANILHYDERWYGVDIQLEQAPMLPAFFGSDGQLKQLLNNLLINSLEAQSQTPHQVSIETQLTAGEIVLAIKDNGCGMDSETLQQAFTAFYTTKNPAVHSGIGLFSCLTIVENHKGRINITSHPEQGTEVRVYLPLSSHAEKDNTNA